MSYDEDLVVIYAVMIDVVNNHFNSTCELNMI